MENQIMTDVAENIEKVNDLNEMQIDFQRSSLTSENTNKDNCNSKIPSIQKNKVQRVLEEKKQNNQIVQKQSNLQKSIKVEEQKQNLNESINKQKQKMNQSFNKHNNKDSNKNKSRLNLCKLSKYIHLLIFQFLDQKNIFKLSSVSRSLLLSSHDDGVWEKYFWNQKRLMEFSIKYGFDQVSKRDLYVHDMKVIGNMTKKKRYQNYNLEGHKDTIYAIDVQNGIIASASKDATVKIWDIERKKAWTFQGRHQNAVNHVILWDKYSAFSAGIDRSIRYFDIRDWGNENENFNEDSETQNGYKYSKFLKGHTKSITNLKRLNNSSTRIVSTSEDSTIKIWDVYANQYCKYYSNSNVVGHKFDDNTEIVEPLISLEGDHQSGVKLLSLNLCYLASYSDQDNCLVIRDWEKPQNPLLKVKNLFNALNIDENDKNKYAVSAMQLCQEDQHLLVTSENMRIRFWDLRLPLLKSKKENSVLVIEDKQSSKLISTKFCDVNAQNQLISYAQKLTYQSSQKRLIAHFSGSNGIHTFDIRKGEGIVNQLNYYKLHNYTITDYDVCKDSLSDYAISVGSTEKYRYDVRPIDLRKSFKQQDHNYELFPGHKAQVMKIRQDGDCIVSADKKGEIKVMKFSLFKGDLSKAPSCITIKS